jgi:hypothetical protein
MATRPTKELKARPANEREQDETPPENVSQRKQPEAGRYSLRVDRQSKRSFTDPATAEAAGAAIKKKYPVVQVVVYDTVELTGKVIEA